MTQQLQEQVRLLTGQVLSYKLRTNALRLALDEAQSSLEHALLSIVVDEAKRNTMLASHRIQRTLDADTLRHSLLDNQ